MIILSLLPMIAFFLLLIFLIALKANEKWEDSIWQEFIIQTILLLSIYMALGFELLSLLKALSTLGVVILWLILNIFLVLMHMKRETFTIGWQRLVGLIKSFRFNVFNSLSFLVIVITLVILLITGIMSPPNIHDVLAYHMARVMHWVQNSSFTFYPSVNTWQLWMPPFSEYIQLNGQLLSGSDVFSSLNNWYSLIFSMVAISGVAKYLGANQNGQILSAMFVMTLPIIVLQASGAKNDIVLGFLVSAFLFYVVKANFTKLSILDYILCSIAFGLGILTKGTFIIFVTPLLIWLLIVMIKQSGWKQVLLFAGVGLVITIVLNGGHWLRNTFTFGSPVFSGEESFLINARFGLDVIVSNLSRNSAVQLNGIYGFINEGVQTGLGYIHSWLNIPLFDPLITLGPREFYYVPTREEVAGNTFHFLLTGLVFIIAPFFVIREENRKKTMTIIFLSLASIFGVILFSAIFRWQTWGTRFFIPYYVMFAPVFGYIFGKISPPLGSWIAGIVLVVIMVNPLMNNYSRSFSWAEENRNSIWRRTRRGLLFSNNQHIEGIVLELTHLMEVSGCRTYGLILRPNGPEYLLWGALTPRPGDYYIEHIKVNNLTAMHSTEGLEPCGIVFFEVSPFDDPSFMEYQIAQKWQIGEEKLFTLLLTPDYMVDG